ncbi:MAG: PqqD family protein [Acidobacteria bacterium]|jgi:Coenzyme PQQ synthesis protein D (PqqD)|nr:MAG: PqqD family protein [Acidobacteriota bacterium]
MGARTISNSAFISAASDVLVSEFGEELVILNLRDGVYYGLEDVGSRIWSLLQEPVTISMLRDALVEEFDVDPARSERDVRALLEELAAHGLVEIQER